MALLSVFLFRNFQRGSVLFLPEVSSKVKSSKGFALTVCLPSIQPFSLLHLLCLNASKKEEVKRRAAVFTSIYHSRKQSIFSKESYLMFLLFLLVWGTTQCAT
jgi:hypothetical protein